MSDRQESDVLVIGGGVIGLSAALRLRQRGLSVTLLERHECGREASWAGVGMLNPPNRRGPIQRLIERSLQLYEAFCAELTDLTGIDPEYEVCGSMELLATEQRYRMALSEQRAAERSSPTSASPALEVLTVEAARQIEPALLPGADSHAGDPLGVLYVREAAQVRSPRLLSALQAGCGKLGVAIREHAPVTDWLLDTAACVVGVQVGGGALHARHVVLCAGAWSGEIAGRFRATVPVYPVRGQVILLWMPDRPFRPLIERGSTYLVPRRDGHILVGSTEEHDSGFEKANTPAAVQMLLNAAAQMVPRLADASVVGMWSGLRPGTPDRRPCIGFVPGVEGLIVATGHFRSGLTLAPVTADIVADLITTGTTPYDLSLCRPGRNDGIDSN